MRQSVTTMAMAVVLLATSLLNAQPLTGTFEGQITPSAATPERPDFLKQTLNYVNVTSTNIHQTVPEVTTNEKEVAFGDIDHDGDLDVAVAVGYSDFQDRRNKLYINNHENNPGLGNFTEVSGTAVIPGFSISDATRCAFLRDYDDDGWLDMIIVNDSNNGVPEGKTRYYSNKHPGGVFSNFVNEEDSRGLNITQGAACNADSEDFDGDGDYDLYMGNYPFNNQDRMYLNDGSGHFTEVTNTHVPTDSDYTVDVTTGDVNNDGQKDLIITSHFDPSYVYYNNNSTATGNSSGEGDFRYDVTGRASGRGALQQLAPAGNGEIAATPGDFNNDGLLDLYFSNRGPNFTDKIYRNTGIDVASNEAIWNELDILPVFTSTESRKPIIADLNSDGRVDVIVMADGRRPCILRNTSVNGVISFVDWTPAPAFPAGTTHTGWHSAVFDANGDGRKDIFLGGRNNDHLFLRTASTNLKEGAFGGVLPPVYNQNPLAVKGKFQQNDRDTYTASGIPAGAIVSVIVRTCANVTLEIRNSGGGLVGASNRGDMGVEEALQIAAPGGNISIEVMNTGQCHPVVDVYLVEVLSRGG